MKNICTPLGWFFLFAASTSRVSKLGFDRLMFPCRHVRPQGRPRRVCMYGGIIETKVQGMATHLHTGVG